MLAQLFINNIAVIERASIDLDQGFTVLTGETGAGKSIIIDAIHAVLGERTSKELVRTGEPAASVSALFTGLSQDTLELLSSLSVPEEDNSLLIQRNIRLEGKSTCKLNGAPATVSMLKTIAPRLVGIHGQHESYELLSPELHMNYIDSFARLESLLERYQASYRHLRELQRELRALNTDEGEKTRRMDLLRYQIDEIEGAGITPGERETLTQNRELVRNSEKVSTAVEQVKALLSGDEDSSGTLSDISQAAGELERASAYLPQLEEPLQKLREAGFLLEDASSLLHGLAVDFDPSALDGIEERLDQLYRLGLKYGETEEQMLQYLADCQEELHKIEFSDEEREKLREAYEEEKRRAIALAKELSEKRKAAGERFVGQVKSELAFLNMPGVEFVVEIERIPLTPTGCDKLQFLVSANKGEPPKPLSKIASGGELSRIMLAVKTVLSGRDKVDTLIFDEVDAGVSGAAANKIGEKLRQVSQNRQVLCITHLPQIAAMADHHLRISKHVVKGRTFTQVDPLDWEGRKQEVARIIGGEDITQLQLDMAEEMLKKT
ncbi:DNA repair protein RecN [Acutalibacter sp. 1XD8-33]|uniref:DNA repair protein RecN n=1 Tax=Acutalibacter sp. 1XD8-33 TaxID=2320081 RepID=UPI000EA24D9B|nr:DNA repair protein RecN [Acutalibacter sp. 1XD8-33]RKJ41010.1 DNA repair protein RecN [Acutalibacter sp. 1XD8-33]